MTDYEKQNIKLQQRAICISILSILLTTGLAWFIGSEQIKINRELYNLNIKPSFNFSANENNIFEYTNTGRTDIYFYNGFFEPKSFFTEDQLITEVTGSRPSLVSVGTPIKSENFPATWTNYVREKLNSRPNVRDGGKESFYLYFFIKDINKKEYIGRARINIGYDKNNIFIFSGSPEGVIEARWIDYIKNMYQASSSQLFDFAD